ncbi:MAG: choice-of-anchor V domain-containing protein [Woeseiaceae bacterium]
MRFQVVGLAFAASAFFMDAARAFPDGAPWGAANPSAEQNCATCHFDDDPVHDSDVLIIDGLPGHLEGGATYDLKINFEDPGAMIAGFQLIAQAVDQHAGTLVSSAADVEFVGATIRSTQPLTGEETISWPVTWRAPATIMSPIVFYVAATAANDDGSPFGDKIHYRTYTLATK